MYVALNFVGIISILMSVFLSQLIKAPIRLPENPFFWLGLIGISCLIVSAARLRELEDEKEECR